MTAYLATLSARFRMLLQYRAAALAGIVTQIVFGLIRVMIFDAFYRAYPQGQPMSAQQTTTYLWLSQAFLLIPMLGADNQIAGLIRSGDIGYELMRPVDLHSYWLARMFATRAAPTAMRAGPILLLAAATGQLLPPASAVHLLLSMVSITLGLFLATSLFSIVTISMLWTLAGEGLSRLVPTFVFFLSGMIIPLPLFPEWCQPIFRAMPFRGLIDVPFRIYLGNLSMNEIVTGFAQQIIWIILFIIAGRLLLARGLRRLVVQGG